MVWMGNVKRSVIAPKSRAVNKWKMSQSWVHGKGKGTLLNNWSVERGQQRRQERDQVELRSRANGEASSGRGGRELKRAWGRM